MRSIIILILLSFVITASGQRAGTVLPVHSIHTGFYATTSGGHAGLFLEYQYYVDDLVSYCLRPGMTGFSKNSDSTNYFIFGGINYRFNALRNPIRKRPVNSQPYAGFYPLSFEYIKIKPVEIGDPNTRFGFVPSGVIGYTIVFLNRIDLDMYAGLGLSFRMSGKAGKPLEPVAFAGIGLGIRL